MQRMEPLLAKTFGFNGTWVEILSQEMEFPDTLPGKIRQNWKGYLAAAYAQGAAAYPSEYAQRFVDENFPDIEPNE